MESLLTMKIAGVSTFMKIPMIPATLSASLSACRVAIVFGDTSPNIRISRVSIPVAIPAPMLPRSLTARVVARDDADRFTMLFPISIAESIFAESSVTQRTLSALLSPASDRVRMRILLTVVSAVSADEKNAENSKSTISIIICAISPASK